MYPRAFLPAAGVILFLAVSPCAAQSPGEQAVRLNAIEEQLRQLTGEVDALRQRLRQLEGAGGIAAQGGQGGPRPSQVASSQAPMPREAQPDAGGPQLGAPPADLGQLRIDDNGRPLDITGLQQALPQDGDGEQPMDSGASLASVGADNPRDAYDIAYGYVLRGDYEEAEQAFGAFIDRYPDNELVPNAKYWIGESFFQRGDYHNAARAFLDNSQSHPESTKAPESLLKLGMSLAALQQKEPACSSLSELMSRYPRAEPSVRDQAQSEMRALGC